VISYGETLGDFGRERGDLPRADPWERGGDIEKSGPIIGGKVSRTVNGRGNVREFLYLEGRLLEEKRAAEA